MSSLQKIIQHQVGVKASLYTNELGASNSKINNTNSGKKHNSYQRRLNELKRKQKDNLYARQYTNSTPLIGNKTESYEIVSRGLTPEKFLNCNITDYINHFGISDVVYNNFSSFTNYPKTLTLTNSDLAYEFETYKDDLTPHQGNANNDLIVSYDTHSTGVYITNGKHYHNNVDVNAINNMLFYIDFKINNPPTTNDSTISDLSGIYSIFETGKLFSGTSLTFYTENNSNDARLNFFMGTDNDNTNINITVKSSINVNERHIFVASFERYDTGTRDFNYVIYLDNEKIIEGSELPLKGFFAKPVGGFGLVNPHTGDNTQIAINSNDRNLVKCSEDDRLNITGEVKILNNTYDELIRSNYFSVNQ